MQECLESTGMFVESGYGTPNLLEAIEESFDEVSMPCSVASQLFVGSCDCFAER